MRLAGLRKNAEELCRENLYGTQLSIKAGSPVVLPIPIFSHKRAIYIINFVETDISYMKRASHLGYAASCFRSFNF